MPFNKTGELLLGSVADFTPLDVSMATGPLHISAIRLHDGVNLWVGNSWRGSIAVGYKNATGYRVGVYDCTGDDPTVVADVLVFPAADIAIYTLSDRIELCPLWNGAFAVIAQNENGGRTAYVRTVSNDYTTMSAITPFFITEYAYQVPKPLQTCFYCTPPGPGGATLKWVTIATNQINANKGRVICGNATVSIGQMFSPITPTTGVSATYGDIDDDTVEYTLGDSFAPAYSWPYGNVIWFRKLVSDDSIRAVVAHDWFSAFSLGPITEFEDSPVVPNLFAEAWPIVGTHSRQAAFIASFDGVVKAVGAVPGYNVGFTTSLNPPALVPIEATSNAVFVNNVPFVVFEARDEGGGVWKQHFVMLDKALNPTEEHEFSNLTNGAIAFIDLPGSRFVSMSVIGGQTFLETWQFGEVFAPVIFIE